MSTATLDPAGVSGATGAETADSREQVWNRLSLAVPCALAAALVFYELATRSLWLDEAATVSIASQHGAPLWTAIAHDGGNMLGYYLLEHLLIGWFGHAPALIRIPSALATVATVGLVGEIGRRLFDRRVACAAGVLAAVSLPLVFWGQDARAYALMVMFICASFLALVRLLEDRPPRWAWIAYAASLVLAIYMSFAAALVLPAQLLMLCWRRRERWRTILVALGAVVVACAPIAVLAARRGSSQLFWVPSPDLKRIDEMLRWITSAGMPPNFHRSATGTVLLVLTLLLLVAVGVRAIRPPDWRPVLLVAWLLVPILLSLGESLAGQPIALARNSIVALPAVALLLAWGAGAYSRGPRSVWIAWGAVTALVVLRALQLAPGYGTSSENWKAAAHFVSARTQPGDCVVFYPLDGWMPFQYYSGAGGLPRSVLPAASWNRARPYVERYVTPSAGALRTIESRCPRLWLVASHEGQPDGPPGARANLARYRALQALLTRGYRAPASAQVKFGWASPVRVRLLSR